MLHRVPVRPRRRASPYGRSDRRRTVEPMAMQADGTMGGDSGRMAQQMANRGKTQGNYAPDARGGTIRAWQQTNRISVANALIVGSWSCTTTHSKWGLTIRNWKRFGESEATSFTFITGHPTTGQPIRCAFAPSCRFKRRWTRQPGNVVTIHSPSLERQANHVRMRSGSSTKIVSVLSGESISRDCLLQLSWRYP